MAAANKVTTKTKDKSVFVMVPAAARKSAQAILDQAPFKSIDLSKDRLISKKDVEYLENVLNVIYPKSRYTPTQLKTSDDDLIETGTLVKYTPRDHKELKDAKVMACVMREWRNSYKIFINELVEDEAYDSADLHEKGHILFNHTQGYQMYIDQFRKEIDKIWDLKLAKYFDSKVFKNNKDKIVKMLFMEFSNIAQDMEINSKLFDNGEWVKAKKTLARSAIIMQYVDLLDNFDELSGLIKEPKARKLNSKEYAMLLAQFKFIVTNIENRINGEEGDFQFCYPANKGWPVKLDWMTYMILLVKDIDETMEQVMKQIEQIIGQGIPSDDDGNAGQGNGQPGDGPSGKQISEDVLNDYFDKADQTSKAEASANGDAGIGDEEDEGNSQGNSIGNQRNKGGPGKSGGSGGVKVEFETCDTFENFTKFLRKSCLGKKNRRWNSDVLYNSNRGKFASRVVVPRRHLIEKWMPTECHIIVDVSGSVPTDYVERVINSIVDTNSGIDLANSHIIFCDTQVVSDEIMSKRTKSVYAGGGTHIANGIKYVAEKGYCRKKSDKLFVISDFEDDLDTWVNAAKDVPGIKYAIGYNVHSEKECNQVFDRFGSNNDNEFRNTWNRTFKTIFITEKIKG